MTLNTTYKPAVAEGNGIIKEFSYSFNPLSLSYIKVYFEIDGKWVEQKTGWSATVSDSGGVVTFLTAPTTRVSIERDVPESQPTSYTTSSGFQAKVIENSFDLLTGMVQELKDASDRSVKVEVGDNQTPEELLEEVYNKLDSATAIAGDAINAANQAQTAADNATAAVNQAEQTLTEVTNYVDTAKSDIENTKNTAISTIANTVVSAKADINTAVDEATTNISNIVSDAEGSITNIAVTEANKAIANAAQEATDTAKANVNSYVNETVKPSLQTYVTQAEQAKNASQTSATASAGSASAAKTSETNAKASETNALSSKNAAATSAQNAANSATQAKGYAQDAATSASLAQIENKITNCITSIPQDIKLELKDGTLTLKAGSKVYVPNGAGVFDEVVTNTDVSRSFTLSNVKILLAYIQNNRTLAAQKIDLCTSGTTAPTGTGLFYNTTNNTIRGYTNGTIDNNNKWSLPLAILTADVSGNLSIDQVFNGFGYIGSTVFALPGVKGLIPNGRNADGSLKNTGAKLTKVITRTFATNVNSSNLILPITANQQIGAGAYVLNYKENILYETSSGVKYTDRYVAMSASVSAGRIISFTPKTAFHAVDYNDYKNADDQNVKLTGNQIIAGEKTFNGILRLDSTVHAPCKIINKDITIDTVPSENKYSQFRIDDKNLNWVAYTGYAQGKNGDRYFSMCVRKPDKSSDAAIKVGYRSNGNIFTYCPTPASTSNTTEIATTAWVRSNISGFYNWDSLVNAGAYDAIYTAPSNGLLGICRTSSGDWSDYAYIYSGTTTSTTVVGAIVSAYKYSNGGSATIPVKKGEQHYVRAPNGSYLFFVPQA